jgi:hypothetical protein
MLSMVWKIGHLQETEKYARRRRPAAYRKKCNSMGPYSVIRENWVRKALDPKARKVQ